MLEEGLPSLSCGMSHTDVKELDVTSLTAVQETCTTVSNMCDVRSID